MTIKILVISGYNDLISCRSEAEAFIGLKKIGVDVHIMSFADSPYRQRFEEQGIRFIPEHPNKKFSLSSIRMLRQLIKKEKYHVAHCFNTPATINCIQASRGLPIKICLYRGFTGHVHWYDPTNYLKYLSPRVSKIMCIAEAPANHIREQKFFDKSKAVVIHKGHDPNWYAGVEALDLSDFGIPTNAFTVVNVANIRPVKGIPYLLQSSYELPKGLPIHYLFVGKGMDTPELQELIANSPYREQIHILGHRKDVYNIVKACDTFVLSSLWGESINKATIEAMSLGVCPIITDIDGNKILVEHQKSGLVVPTRDAKAIADSIHFLYKNADKKEAMAQKAKERMSTVLHIDRTIKEMKDMYYELALEADQHWSKNRK